MAASEILNALRAGGMTAQELAALIGLTYKATWNALQRLLDDGRVSITRVAARDRQQRGKHLYSLPLGGAVDLGPVSRFREGAIARLIGDVVFEHGEVALFIGKNSHAAMAIYHEPGYQEALKRHAGDLVGCYRATEDRRFKQDWVIEDMRQRLDELTPKRRRAA